VDNTLFLTLAFSAHHQVPASIPIHPVSLLITLVLEWPYIPILHSIVHPHNPHYYD